MGQNPNRTPSEHPNPTTKIGSNGTVGFDPRPDVRFAKLPFLLTWHLWEDTWKIRLLLEGLSVRCHVSGREGRWLDTWVVTQ